MIDKIIWDIIKSVSYPDSWNLSIRSPIALVQSLPMGILPVLREKLLFLTS